jgi:uncharacterized protein (DUF362 family)
VNIIKRLFKKFSRRKLLSKPHDLDTVKPRLVQQESDLSIVATGTDLSTILKKIENNQERIFRDFQPGHKVLVKINMNSPFPFPASTSPEMLVGVIDILLQRGIREIIAGDCTSLAYLPTKKVMRSHNLEELLSGKAKLLAFDREKWVKINIDGRYLTDIVVSQSLFLADHIINLSNMKTHVLADFSLGIKNLFGFTHPCERIAFHKDHLQEKIAELSMAIQPDLTIIDSRKLFVSGGPNEGEVEKGDRIFIGSDLLATEAMAYRYLYSVRDRLDGAEKLAKDLFEMRMFSGFGKDRLESACQKVWQEI